MSVQVDLPPDVEERLRAEFPELDADAKEVMLVGLYRQDKLSHRELGESLGLDRLETDALLKKHNVTEDLPTKEEYEAALRRLHVQMEK